MYFDHCIMISLLLLSLAVAQALLARAPQAPALGPPDTQGGHMISVV